MLLGGKLRHLHMSRALQQRLEDEATYKFEGPHGCQLADWWTYR